MSSAVLSHFADGSLIKLQFFSLAPTLRPLFVIEKMKAANPHHRNPTFSVKENFTIIFTQTW